jgi:hypothetical protein
MERGLLWLPLLGLFIGLAWAGWNEYRKIEAYRVWGKTFDPVKYDIYAMAGQRDQTLTWGRPTRQGPIDQQTVALDTVQAIDLYGGDRPVPKDAELPRGCTICLRLTVAPEIEPEALAKPSPSQYYDIPFTDLALAQQWLEQLAGSTPA